jgi:cytoskeletal protein RodZ
VQFLFSVVNAEENPFFSLMFLQTIAFVLVGVAFYWLVLRYVVRVHTDASTTPDDAYAPATHAPPATKATTYTQETYESKHQPPVHTTNTPDDEHATQSNPTDAGHTNTPDDEHATQSNPTDAGHTNTTSESVGD